jgi:hypothetical protein
MTTWDELIRNRIKVPPLRHSAHMLKMREAVLQKYPGAILVDAGTNLWKLRDGTKDLSNAHNSHYACWFEAYKLMQQVQE